MMPTMDEETRQQMLAEEYLAQQAADEWDHRVIDVEVQDYGSVVMMAPFTQAARDWVEENIGKNNGYQPYYPTLVVEKRYVEDIAEGMWADGLMISGQWG